MTSTADLMGSAPMLDQAIARMVEVLGEDSVLTQEQQVREFHDPYEGEGATEFQPSFVVQPSTVEEVQAVVRIAAEFGIRLWTSSMGRNFGYGGSAPVVNGSVVLNLRQMNRILEINEEAGYVLVEPGVRFFDLYNELRARGSKLMMSVPDLGWGNIIGNALEHGYGYTVNGDNAAAACGMEVVLASGEVVRTGQGAITDSPLWQRHKRGFGPSLDSLFMQSNFGIVTKMGLWLMPEPEIFTTGSVICHRDEDIAGLIDALRPLMLDGTVQGHPLIVSSPEPPDGRRFSPMDDTTGQSKKAKLSATLPPGRWDARVSFYGPSALVNAREEMLRAAVSHLPGVTVELRTYPGGVDPEQVHPLDLVPAGIPNMFLLDLMHKHFGESVGHIDFSPVIPFSGEAAARHDAMVQQILDEADLAAGSGWIANSRSLVGVCMVFFDVNDADEARAAREAVRKMSARAAEWGWAEYRAHPLLIEDVTSQFDFNNHALHRLYSRLKDALDPAGILSPGNHGIWPSALRP
ncbi:FAD-binding oxidoreductase [Paenarthrobacter ureafaciens]|uniref:FAD-binding oxidoreductase n=1 Tax=Paenarthrobacter ureafaciens TaxID=37931 RepID=UPI002DB75608|nr:FAD-binding oxidoreductase [Paenarthrobacter ureafaciens]MEC3853896.1 FAD-binding oxidoreductase [Paenarthrobacter ureafaciens]